MKTFVVHVSKMAYLNALSIFSGEVMIGNTRVIIGSGTRSTTVVGSRVVKDYDLLIDPSINTTTQESGRVDEDSITIPRYGKAFQSVMLAVYIKHVTGLKHYYEIPTYGLDKGIPHYLPTGPYIIKPEFGARGLGIMKFHTQDISPYKVDKVLTNLKERISTDKTVDVKSELSKVGIELMDSEENTAGESISNLWSGSSVVQSNIGYMPDIKEIRVLMCKGVDPLYYNREDLLNKTVTYSTRFRPVGEIEERLFEEFRKVIEGDFPQLFGSVDIWYSVAEEKWGIFEYQPQYDYSNICQEQHYHFMKASLKSMINMVYPKLDL